MNRGITVSRPGTTSTLSVRGLVLVAGVLVAIAGGATSALAQEKPSSLPLGPAPIPEVDVARWAEAYQRAGRPRVLVLAGEGTGQQRGLSPAALLSNEDDSAISSKLRASFLEALNSPEADIEVVADNDWRAALGRLRANTDLNRERDASRLVAQQLDAELLILLKLVKSQRPGSPFSVIVEASDAARGRQGLTFTYDWKGPLDAIEFKEYAAEMAIKFTEDYARRTGSPVRQTIQILGLTTPEQQGQVKEALSGLSGVRTVRTRTSAAATGGRSEDGVIEYELAFGPGTFADSTDIKAELAASLAARGYGVEDRQTEPGRIAVRVTPGNVGVVTLPIAAATATTTPATPATGASSTAAATTTAPVLSQPVTQPVTQTVTQTVTQPVTLPASVDAACATGKKLTRTQRFELFQGVRDAYAAKGAPRVVVIVNRAATHDEGERLAPASGTGTPTATAISVIASGNSVVGVLGAGGRPGMAPPPSGARFIAVAPLEAHSRRFESELSRTLQFGLGITNQISPDAARARLLASVGDQRTMAGDELLGLLGKENIADIAIVAWGYGVDDAQGARIEYVFEAVDLKTSQRLASGRGSGALEDTDLDALMGDMADDAATWIACGLRSSWASAR